MNTTRLSDQAHGWLAWLQASPLTAVALAVTVMISTWVLHDYREWLAFGTGGTPSNFRGYFKMTRIRITNLLTRPDLYDLSPLTSPGPNYLKDRLPPRTHRPTIMSRTMPQRQQPEAIEPEAQRRLLALMQTFQTRYPDLLEVRPSKTEGGTADAIYARKDLKSLNPVARHAVLDHEIAHVHPSDHSLHIWLSHPDARTVVERGWGVRFPIRIADEGFVMVWAPRTVVEVDAVESIVGAAVAWITGGKVDV